MNTEKKWYAVYTKPKWEKKSDGIFKKKGITSWCPTHKVEKRWTDRKKIIDVPIFKSYLFVYVTNEEKADVLRTDGILNFVHSFKKPAVIKEEEIQEIKKYLAHKDAKISLIELEGFKTDDKVQINFGVFINNIGTITKGGKRKVFVRLESLSQVMVVEFSTQDISLANV